MHEAVQKADVLIEALGWIRRFRGKITVIKLGGSVIENREALRHTLIDIVFMESVGMKPVVVHGGGAAISRAMESAGIVPRFVHGRRYTDEGTLQIVQQVLAKETNEQLTQFIGELGGFAKSLNFETGIALHGRRLELRDADDQSLDLGYVGHVTQVDTARIRQICDQDCIPVIPSMCGDLDRDGALNVNADTAAMAVAQELHAEKLVYLSDVNGVRMDKNDPASHIHSLSASQARQLIANGNIDAGMIPKVEACLDTLQHGVRKVHIVDGNLRHSLLLEIYTTSGVGTEIYQDQ